MAPSGYVAASPYDHDKWGWVMVATLFICNLVVYGNLKALGVLLIPMTNDLDSELWLVGLIAVFYGIMNRCMGPVVAAACRLLGSRPMMVFGGLLSTLGFMLTSISTSVFAVAVFIVGLSGVGSAFSLFISTATMASYFKENYPLAIGISTMGVPTGVMVYGPMTQVLLDTYGWRRTMLLLGGISFHLVACAVLMRRNPPSSAPDTEKYQEVAVSDEEEKKDNSSNHREHRARQCCQNILKAIDLVLLTDVRLVLLICAGCTASLTYRAWLVYMVPHGQFQGLSDIQASFLPTSYGVGNAMGKLIMPFLQQVGIKPSMTLWACFGASVVCVSFLLHAFVRPFIGQLVITGLVGVGYALTYQANDVMIRFLHTDDRFVSVLGWQGVFVGVAGILGGLISGWVYEWTGSFSIALFIFSGVILLSIPLFLAEAIYAKRKAH